MNFLCTDQNRVTAGGKVWGEMNFLVVSTIGFEIVPRHIPVVPHAAEENVFSIVKAAGKALDSVVPLADFDAVIAAV